jgi:Cdc6-like AAA superfamily ATPase
MSQTPSTLQLIERVNRAHIGARAAILHGNTGDLFVGPDGKSTWLRLVLASWGAGQGQGTISCSPVRGAQLLTPPGHEPLTLHLPHREQQPTAAIEDLLREVRRSEDSVLVILDWAEHPLPDLHDMVDPERDRMVELLANFVSDPHAIERGHRLVVIARAGAVDRRLARLPGFELIDVPLPNHAERLAFVNRLLDPKVGEPLRLEDGMTAEAFATLTGGLSLDDLNRGRRFSRCAGPIGRAWAQTTKIDRRRSSSSQGLTVHEPGNGLADVSGLPQFRYLVERAMKVGRFPRAILAAGPPGVGKTLMARAIGDVMGIPVYSLGNFRSRFVGDTESNLEHLLRDVESSAPCVLILDEIDQLVGHRQEGDSADGGTSERSLAMLMSFLGDRNRSEHVTIFATTNRPDLLDPAMFDRFTIIPVLHPTPIEAAGILAVAARVEGRIIDTESATKVIANYGQLLTGRVLVDVLDEAMTTADLDGESTAVSASHLDETLADLNMALDPLEHEHLALRAIKMTTFKRYLPWRAAQALGEPVYLPSYVTSLLHDDRMDIDMNKLNSRLNELEGRRVRI